MINILGKSWTVITVMFRVIKSKLGRVILVVLAVSCCFTCISYRNYVKGLPLVTLTSSISNKIKTQMAVTGSLYYNEVLDVTLPQDCYVEEVFVLKGDAVEEGSPLLRIKVADLQAARLNKQLQIETLEKVEESGTEGELAYWKKAILLEEVAALEELIAEEGVVKVEGLPRVEGETTTDKFTERENETESDDAADGKEVAVNPMRVIALTYTKGDRTKPDVPITLGLPEGGCYLEWQISAEDYNEYTGMARIRYLMENLTWDTPVFENDVYIYRSYVDTPENFVNGELVSIELNYEKEYISVLPRACIRIGPDGSPYVYEVHVRARTYGEEQYVRRIGVTILEQDAVNVAVIGRVNDVVQGSSKQLQDLMAVRVIEE